MFDYNINYFKINPEELAEQEKYPFVTIHAICCFVLRKGQDVKNQLVRMVTITPCPSYFKCILEKNLQLILFQ